MRGPYKTKRFFLVLPILLLIVSLCGCTVLEDFTDRMTKSGILEGTDLISDEDPVSDDIESESLDPGEAYYWPLISHGHLDLSSGEIIIGPDIFASTPGFIGEFSEGERFSGTLIWTVSESDVFSLQWIKLLFNVDYYVQQDLLFDLFFDLMLDNFSPQPGDEGIQEFAVALVERREGFEIAINRVILGKQQKSAVTGSLIDYIALELEMRVVE